MRNAGFLLPYLSFHNRNIEKLYSNLQKLSRLWNGICDTYPPAHNTKPLECKHTLVPNVKEIHFQVVLEQT